MTQIKKCYDIKKICEKRFIHLRVKTGRHELNETCCKYFCRTSRQLFIFPLDDLRIARLHARTGRWFSKCDGTITAASFATETMESVERKTAEILAATAVALRVVVPMTVAMTILALMLRTLVVLVLLLVHLRALKF